MAFAKANPNEYLVIGRGGSLINKGTGIKVFLWPGSTCVLIPSTKQEATFEMTQETKDGIPLHFKGVVIYRITEPTAAAANFNFNDDTGIQEINTFIRNICLGELRAVVSGMTMQECIEQRKTVLTTAVETALKQVVLSGKDDGASHSNWGIELEMVQVAQVYIIDNELRKQLEAEIRNDIRAKSDQSNIRTVEETRLAQIASERRIQEQKLESEKDGIRQKQEIDLANIQNQRRLQKENQETEEEKRLVQIASERRIQEQKLESEKDGIRQKEALDLANLQCQRRLQKENQETEREAILLAMEKFRIEQEAEREKIEIESPIRLLQIEKQRSILNEELEMQQVETQVRELEVKQEMLLETARHNLRKEIMPVEQVPGVAESLSKVFQGANLSYFGSENQTLSSILPLFDFLSKMVRESLSGNSEAREDQDGAA